MISLCGTLHSADFETQQHLYKNKSDREHKRPLLILAYKYNIIFG